jgi:hypothetical protein
LTQADRIGRSERLQGGWNNRRAPDRCFGEQLYQPGCSTQADVARRVPDAYGKWPGQPNCRSQKTISAAHLSRLACFPRTWRDATGQITE